MGGARAAGRPWRRGSIANLLASASRGGGFVRILDLGDVLNGGGDPAGTADLSNDEMDGGNSTDQCNGGNDLAFLADAGDIANNCEAVTGVP